MQFQELRTEDAWTRAWPVLVHLRKSLNKEEFLRRRAELQDQGFLLFGLSEGEQLRCVASGVVTPHVSQGQSFWIHDLVCSPDARSQGFGKRMMQELHAWAKEQGCFRVCVHTRVSNERAQSFYREKAEMDGYAIVFQKVV